jgi:DNA-binding transcriptional regulator LsrR (DeoR family)
MMTKYKSFEIRYKQSGLTQKEFAKREGISSGMVGYYLRRARQEQKRDGFAQIEVTPSEENKVVSITTPGGVVVTIPI